MARIEVTNITPQTLYFRQLSVPDAQIESGVSIDLTEFNTYKEITEDEELLQYLEEGKVSINNGHRDLSSTESLNVFEGNNVHASHAIELQIRTPNLPGGKCWNASLEFWRVR